MKPISKHIIYIISLIISLSIFYSCEIINPAEPIPSYIRIEKINLLVTDTSSSGQGTRSHKLTDAWVYIDDNPVGAFELPVTFPVLYSGNHRITVRAGIKMNGISSTRTQYPFLTSFTQDADLQSGGTITLDPTVSYFSNTIFDWIEDFEGSGFKFLKSPHGTDTVIKTTTVSSEVFEGLKSGATGLDGSHGLFEAVSSTALNIPKNTPVFLEMNYRCNQEFAVGVYASNSNSPLVSLYINATDDWNKIYVNLSDAVNTTGFNPPFTFFIGMAKDANVAAPVLYIDNLKILHL